MRNIRGFGLALSMLTAVLVSYVMISRMEQELLWGWRPLIWLVAVWTAILIMANWRVPARTDSMRWVGLSTLSGVILSLGFPPSALTPLMFVGFVPLLQLQFEIRQKDEKNAAWRVFRHSVNAFIIWNIGTTWWLLNTSFLPGIVAIVLNGIFMATVFTLYHKVTRVLSGNLQLLAFIALFIGFEYLHLFWDLSWPWLNLGHSFAEYPHWVQWYEYTGIFGGSLWILLTNYLIWTWLRKRWGGMGADRLWRAGLGLLILVPMVVGLLMYYSIDPGDGDVEVVVVQPNFEPHYEKFTYDRQVQLERFLKLSRSAVTGQTDYLVFPETSFSFVNLNNVERDRVITSLREFMRDYPDLRIVTGLESYRTHPHDTGLNTIRTWVRGRDTMYLDVQNSAIQLAAGEPIEPYFKSKLVPGPEFFPFRPILRFAEPLIHMLDGSIEGLTRQEKRAVFTSPVANVAPIICYESVFGEYVGEYVREGAGILFIITNDGWWDKTPGHVQHLKIGALRAIEHRRPIARSANTGVSCFIDIRGDILQPTEYGVEAAITGKLEPGEGYTFYTRWGDVIARLSAFLAVVLLILTVVNLIMRKLGIQRS